MNEAWGEFELFSAAMQLDARERSQFLRERCLSEEMYTRLTRLLARGERMPSSFLAEAVTIEQEDAVTLTRIDEYHIVRTIGRGSMGIVLQAIDSHLDRDVAIKILTPGIAVELGGDSMIKHEGRAIASLKHPGIIEVYRRGEHGGKAYIVMQYVDDGTLRDWLDRMRSKNSPGQPWSMSQVETIVRVMAELARAVDHAHSQGVIHSDIKPSNILMDRDGHPILTDFGVAIFKNGVKERRGGTRGYMPPEASADVEPDEQWDVYSLGAVLYEALTGVVPGIQGPVKISDARGNSAEPVGRRCPNAGGRLELLCRAALSPLRSERYQTAGHLAVDLRACLIGEPLLIDPPIGRVVRRFARRHRRRITWGAVLALLMTSVGLGALAEHRRRAAMARWAIGTVPANLNVRITPVAFAGGAMGNPISVVAPAGLRVNPGLYRVVAEGEGERFAEAMVYLGRGVQHTTELRVPEWSRPDDDDMVRIEGGIYDLGVPGLEGSRAERQVRLESYYIDRAEVSNAEYLEFAQANAFPLPPHLTPEMIAANSGLADRPIAGVTWDEASAYAAWRGKRLPTADEWECAMRLPDGRRNPWGDAPPPGLSQTTLEDRDRADLALADWAAGFAEYLRGTTNVRSNEGISPLGIHHASTNVDELTCSVDSRTNQVIVKGANWLRAPRHIDLTVVQTLPLTSGPASLPTRSLKTGFRCARSVHP